MANKNSLDSYTQPHYTNLQSGNRDNQAEFTQELFGFLERYPEFTNNPSQMNMLHYCFNHYINYDPAYRDLPLQDKIKQAGEMAAHFMGTTLEGKAGRRSE